MSDQEPTPAEVLLDLCRRAAPLEVRRRKDGAHEIREEGRDQLAGLIRSPATFEPIHPGPTTRGVVQAWLEVQRAKGRPARIDA